jgi:hypothetical protein
MAIAWKATILSLITGVIAAILLYYKMMRAIKKLVKSEGGSMCSKSISLSHSSDPSRYARLMAVIVPIALALDLIAVILFRISGGPLICGTAVLLLILVAFCHHGRGAYTKIVDYLRNGFIETMRIFAIIIPICSFYLMGSSTYAPSILAKGAPGYLEEIGRMIASVPFLNKPLVAGVIALTSAISSFDAVGADALPMLGSLSKILAPAVGWDVVTACAVALQFVYWIGGGGTLIYWSKGVMIYSGAAKVKPLDLVRELFIPVIIGLIVSFIISLFL